MGDGAGLKGWIHEDNGGPGAGTPVTMLTNPADIASVDFNQYRVLYVPSSFDEIPGGITQPQLDALNARQPDIEAWFNNPATDGRILALSEFPLVGALSVRFMELASARTRSVMLR